MSFRFALETYLKSPELYQDNVIYYDENFVVIKDKFNKSIIHYLILPRDIRVTKEHPLIAFEDEKLKAETEKVIAKVKKMVLEKLKKEFNIEETEKFIQVGVHSVPSMANLHVHVMTKDFNSEKMKNKKHYNSFTTDFFVKFEDLPLNKEDKRLDKHEAELLVKKSDMRCVYCGQNFKNKFVELKKHITMEFNRKYKLNKKRKITEVIEID